MIVVSSSKAGAVLGALVLAGEPLSREAIANAIGCRKSNVGRIVDGLLAKRLVRLVERENNPRHYKPLVGLTWCGRGEAKRAGFTATASEPRIVPTLRLAARPMREIGTPEADVAPPSLPEAFTRFRGTRHPEPPRPHVAPAKMRPDTWAAMTTIRPFMGRGEAA